MAPARLLAATLVSSMALTPLAAQNAKKLLVAHRGASAYAPEHTLASYRLALEQRADFIEQDLGLTGDGVLVCLHDPTLERTTNVEEVFPERFRTVDGARRWFVRDFTLDEVRRLDAGAWFSPDFAGARVPTFQEAIDLIKGRAGLFPELKAPAVYRDGGAAAAAGAAGGPLEAALVEALKRNGLARPGADSLTPVIVQSFDADALRAVARDLPGLPRTFLLEARDGARWMTAEGLDAVKAFATGIGPAKALIDIDPALVTRAHERGLTVIPYTFRARATGRFPDATTEMRHFLFEYGVDGLFTDNPDLFPSP
ncbi:MAG TPA: glycerophosphodiester phosphodiesterase family protein [Methylomirabilota bacterium]